MREETKTLQQVADKFPRKTKGSGIAPETAWERSELIEQLLDKLMKERASVVLLGEQGIGKTVILLEAARKLYNLTKDRPEGSNYFWRTTPQRMIAGARYLGEWQETCMVEVMFCVMVLAVIVRMLTIRIFSRVRVLPVDTFFMVADTHGNVMYGQVQMT